MHLIGIGHAASTPRFADVHVGKVNEMQARDWISN
jgi:hypothetical protein